MSLPSLPPMTAFVGRIGGRPSNMGWMALEGTTSVAYTPQPLCLLVTQNSLGDGALPPHLALAILRAQPASDPHCCVHPCIWASRRCNKTP